MPEVDACYDIHGKNILKPYCTDYISWTKISFFMDRPIAKFLRYEKIFYIVFITIKTLGAPMAINQNLLTGQFCPLGENKIEESLSATSKVMPTHAGNRKVLRHLTPRKSMLGHK